MIKKPTVHGKIRISDKELSKSIAAADMTAASLLKHIEDMKADKKKWLSDKDEYIGYLRETYSREVDRLNQVLGKRDDEINRLRLVIEEQKRSLGRIRSSVIFPLYQFTSGIGKTRFGQLLQKILK